MKNLFIFLSFLSASLVILCITKQSYNMFRANNIAFMNDSYPKPNINSISGIRPNKNIILIQTSKTIQPKKNYRNLTVGLKLSRNMIAIIQEQKLKIRQEMQLLNNTLDIPLTNKLNSGVPTRSLIVTTYRSGSTLTSEILNSHPGTFNYYEPLYKLHQFHPSKLKAIIRDLLECHIPDWYLDHMKSVNWMFPHNSRLQDYCKRNESLCSNTTFVESMCQQFPYISMKITRLRLRHFEQFLKDSKLNLNIAYLVRDPRGTMTSRHRAYWCMIAPHCGNYAQLCDDLRDDYYAAKMFLKLYPTKFRLNLNIAYLVRDPRGTMTSRHRAYWCMIAPHCGNYAQLCDDLRDDYYAAKMFLKLYPTKFRIIRYEDLSLDPFHEVPRIFDFFKLQFNEKSKKFLEEHTTVEEQLKNAYSTIRNSTKTSLLWRNETSYKVIQEVQEKCNFALHAWGYLLVKNASQQKLFNPLVKPFKFVLL